MEEKEEAEDEEVEEEEEEEGTAPPLTVSGGDVSDLERESEGRSNVGFQQGGSGHEGSCWGLQQEEEEGSSREPLFGSG